MDIREPLWKGAMLGLEPRMPEMDGQSRIKILQGEPNNIVIEKQIGWGSTSIVYEGRISGGTRGGTPVIVKEFYPQPENGNFYDVHREADGKLRISKFADGNSSYQKRKDQFLKCAEKQRALSHDENVREIIVHYEGFYQYGDSYYILSQAHSGHVLQFEQFRFLTDKLEIMKDVADMISVLHCSNYLFMDLCPQNLLWVNVSDARHLMKLFDADSILDLTNITNIQRSDFYLPGRYDSYDAPEMRELLNEPADEFETMKGYTLNTAMNIYNMGILFFEILFERLPLQEELNFGDNAEVGLVREFTNRYQNSLYGLEDVISQNVIHMLKTALSENPEKRMTAGKLSAAVKHIMEKIESVSVIAQARREITEASRAQLLETIGTKTRIIAFDESGQFDSANPEICFIGGFTGDFHDADAERKALEELLRDACVRFNREKLMELPIEVRYPGSLHGSGSPFFKKKLKDDKASAPERKPLEGKERNKYFKLEKEFKNEYLEKAVVEYLEQKKYRLFVFMNIPKENRGDTDPNISRSNLTDMERGSNLYERMAILTLYDYVFSTEHDVDNYRFELPTRTLDAVGDEDLYSVYANNRGDVKKSITNTSTYKTAMSVMLFEKNKDIQKLDTNYVFNVSPINYFDARKETTPFLYAADIVCRYIREQIELADRDGAGWKADKDGFLAHLHGISKADIHIYGACEDLYRTMVDKVKRVDIGEYYALCYDLEHTDEPYRKFYMEYWFPRVEQFLSACLQTEQFSDQFKDRIPEYIAYMEMFMGKKDLHYEKGMYIAEHMEKYILSLRKYNNRNAALFDIYDIILRGYNHRGALDQVREYITKCETYKNYVEMPKYIEHIPRVMQMHFNSLDYEAALEIGNKFEEGAKKLKKAYESFYKVSNEFVLEVTGGEGNVSKQLPIRFVGKIYSSIGQAYAFMGIGYYNKSKNYFEKALAEFDNHSADYSITLSYYLHLMIANNKEKAYKEHAGRYFESDDLYQQMDNALKDDYKLFVFVKAFNAFYVSDKANWDIFDELLNRIKLLDSRDKAHPWELIYKNLYECILKQHRDMLEYRAIRANALSCVRNAEYTIKMIQIHSKFVFAELENREKFEACDLEELLDDDDIDLCEKVIGKVRDMTPTELKKVLDGKMNYYMYN